MEIDDQDIATLIYTSGTEAAPKGVMNTHRNYYSAITSFFLDADMRTEDVYLSTIPLYHVGGIIILTAFNFNGGTNIVTYVPNPVQMLELIPKHKVTFLVEPPTVYAGMTQLPGFEDCDLSSIEKCLSFGALINRPSMETWNKKAPGIQWWSYWGQSELSPLGITGKFKKTEELPNQDLRWIGKPMCTLETKLVDDKENDVPIGEIGEIVARGPSVMLGYYKNEEKTKEAFKNGWLHTGDLAMMDEEGNYYFVDRKKDIVKSGGENVST
ncbi:MAG: Long-chain-fatty-acid--CoA ligase [Candidatus Methanolliviera sp. GoM_asphalt]|nr:MAG: Long-chain-fatty-acid--CoA ligase [Candidatus Methanolliviera sp. GoM_asphalt]